MRKRKEQVRVTLRLPVDAKAFIERQAETNFTSENAEIVLCIRKTMKIEPTQAIGAPQPNRGR